MKILLSATTAAGLGLAVVAIAFVRLAVLMAEAIEGAIEDLP